MSDAQTPGFETGWLASRGLRLARTAPRRGSRTRCRSRVYRCGSVRRWRPLNDATALFRGHFAPLLAQLLAPLRRHLSKPVELLAHALLALGRKRFELLPALP